MEKYVWADTPSQTAFPIAKPGYPFIGAAAFVTAVVAVLGMKVLALSALLVTFGICMFFRDPDRVIPDDETAVVSPADGRILLVESLHDERFYGGDCTKISIFMSVFNVHVNRIPFSGRIEQVRYHPGKFFSANLDKASADNEHNAVKLRTASDDVLWFVQVAGLVARRIVSGLQPGHVVVRGQRFGMICFGSRLDVYLPAGYRTSVSVGDNVSAGHSILGYVS